MGQPMGGGFPNQFQTGVPQQPMGFNPMQAQANPMGAFGTGPINPPGKFGGGNDGHMPDFLKKKQEEAQQNVKSDLSGLMNLDPSKFNLGVQGGGQSSSRGQADPFANFAPAATEANPGTFFGNSASANQDSNKDEFGDLFNKDWLKGSSQNVKRKVDNYAYNPVDLSSMPAGGQQKA